jgi:hypothetical protein
MVTNLLALVITIAPYSLLRRSERLIPETHHKIQD